MLGALVPLSPRLLPVSQGRLRPVQAFGPRLRPGQRLFSRHPPLSQSPAPSGALGAAHSGSEPPASSSRSAASARFPSAVTAPKLPCAAAAWAPPGLCAALPAPPLPSVAWSWLRGERRHLESLDEGSKKHCAAAVLTLWDYCLAKWDGGVR